MIRRFFSTFSAHVKKPTKVSRLIPSEKRLVLLGESKKSLTKVHELSLSRYLQMTSCENPLFVCQQRISEVFNDTINLSETLGDHCHRIGHSGGNLNTNHDMLAIKSK